MPRRKFSGAALPAVAVALPLLAAAGRLLASGDTIRFWGDQALIDIEARNSLLGRNLLGVYDRYGWHHLGPLWLLVLGVFRWLGGGAPDAVLLGNYFVEVVAAAAIIYMANRLRPGGGVAWWAALAVLGYEWSFGLARLGTIWAPYAIALPAALMVLLVADIVASPNPWGPTIAAAVCASFLCQTDISTGIVVGALVVVTPFIRLAGHVRSRARADGEVDSAGHPAGAHWGWRSGNWRLGALALLVVAAVLWLPPVVQQLSSHPGNMTRVYRFLSKHPARESLQASLEAAGTVFGSFPLRLGEQAPRHDADPFWLVARSVWERPWYLVYLVATATGGAYALVRRQRAAFSVAATSVVSMLAAVWSVHSAYGPLYPYLVLWTGALVIPAWVALFLALEPAFSGGQSKVRGRPRGPAWRRRLDQIGPRRLGTGLVVAVALAVTSAFAVSGVPLSGQQSKLAVKSWRAVAAQLLAPGVKTVYIDIATTDAMPDAAAIADEAARRGLRVELDKAALYYLDPSFAPVSVAQVRVVVCCGRGDRSRRREGMDYRGKVDGERIYLSTKGFVPAVPTAHAGLGAVSR